MVFSTSEEVEVVFAENTKKKFNRVEITFRYSLFRNKRFMLGEMTPSETLQNLPYFWNMKTHVHT